MPKSILACGRVLRCSPAESLARPPKEARSEALLYLHPPIDGFKLLGFDDFDSIVDAGYRHTQQMLERWERRGEFVGLVRTPDRLPSS